MALLMRTDSTMGVGQRDPVGAEGIDHQAVEPEQLGEPVVHERIPILE